MRDHLRKAIDRFVAQYLPAGATGQASRAARRFGLIAAAGEIATRLRILPWEVSRAVGVLLGHWLEAALNMGEYPQAFERYMQLALKAQSQCRATLETLAAIKNPPIVYARQANIANGPQQVNNRALPDNPPRTGKTENQQNELLRLDDEATGWTPEQRTRQAELIRQWKPWERSTGPLTAEGKARSASFNGYCGNRRRNRRGGRSDEIT